MDLAAVPTRGTRSVTLRALSFTAPFSFEEATTRRASLPCLASDLALAGSFTFTLTVSPGSTRNLRWPRSSRTLMPLTLTALPVLSRSTPVQGDSAPAGQLTEAMTTRWPLRRTS